MAATVNGCVEEIVQAAGIATQVRRGGRGTPLLVIHGELGVPGWTDALSRLAQSFDVIVPSLPGYGRSERPDWIMGVHDLAAWVTWFARDYGLTTPLNVVGLSMGGWVAAEIATIAPQFLRKLVLVGATGVKPEHGEIWDYFLEGGRRAFWQSFHKPDESAEFATYYGGEWSAEFTDLVEQHREMTCRIAWKPYMHSLTLPNLLAGVRTETLVVWGREDAIVPLASGEQYQRAIPGARLEVVERCGHMVEMERPDVFAALVSDFLRG